MNRPNPTTATTTVVVVVAVIIIIIIILYCLYYIYGFPKHHKPKDVQNLHKNACKEKEILSLRICAACMCNRAATTHLVFRIIRLQKIVDTK